MKLTSVTEGKMVGHELMERGRWVIRPEAILIGIHEGGEPDQGSGETWPVVTRDIVVIQCPNTWLGSS